MNRNVGTSFTLSVLVVCFFAVVLYPDEGTPPPCSAKTSVAKAETPETPSPDPPPMPTPGVPRIETTEVSAPEPAPKSGGALEAAPTPQPAPAQDVPARPAPVAPPAADPPTVRNAPVALTSPATNSVRAQTVSRRRAVAPPREHPAFTIVGAGESLADVAIRVYGSSEEAEALWLANRDAIERCDAPLRVGMLLRTP